MVDSFKKCCLRSCNQWIDPDIKSVEVNHAVDELIYRKNHDNLVLAYAVFEEFSFEQ